MQQWTPLPEGASVRFAPRTSNAHDYDRHFRAAQVADPALALDDIPSDRLPSTPVEVKDLHVEYTFTHTMDEAAHKRLAQLGDTSTVARPANQPPAIGPLLPARQDQQQQDQGGRTEAEAAAPPEAAPISLPSSRGELHPLPSYAPTESVAPDGDTSSLDPFADPPVAPLAWPQRIWFPDTLDPASGAWKEMCTNAGYSVLDEQPQAENANRGEEERAYIHVLDCTSNDQTIAELMGVQALFNSDERWPRPYFVSDAIFKRGAPSLPASLHAFRSVLQDQRVTYLDPGWTRSQCTSWRRMMEVLMESLGGVLTSQDEDGPSGCVISATALTSVCRRMRQASRAVVSVDWLVECFRLAELRPSARQGIKPLAGGVFTFVNLTADQKVTLERRIPAAGGKVRPFGEPGITHIISSFPVSAELTATALRNDQRIVSRLRVDEMLDLGSDIDCNAPYPPMTIAEEEAFLQRRTSKIQKRVADKAIQTTARKAARPKDAGSEDEASRMKADAPSAATASPHSSPWKERRTIRVPPASAQPSRSALKRQNDSTGAAESKRKRVRIQERCVIE